jgi:predicted lipid-binding transport protein (Tim44 family)
MKKLLSTLIILFVAWGLMISDADARRFGGARSFGMQRASQSYARPSAAPAAQAARGNRWLAPLAGLAAGGLLASLFMGHGIASGLLSWLLVGGICLLAFQWFSRRFSMNAATQSPRANFNTVANPFTATHTAPTSTSAYPAGFDTADFLRQAKVAFLRLQAAYDTKNLADLREFTAPEVYGEIQLQLQERGDAPNQTDVISLEGEVLDATTTPGGIVASVRFSGVIREEVNAPAEAFAETWHFLKNNDLQKWLVVGVQQ